MQSVIMNLLYLTSMMDLPHDPLTQPMEDRNDSRTEALEQCFRIYGTPVCFPLASPWVNGSELLSKYPLSPGDIDTTFYIYSKANLSYPKILDPNNLHSLLNSPINRSKPVRIMIHGFLSSNRATWIQKIIGELFRADEDNVIVVDWRKGSYLPYVQALANIRIIGVQLGQLIFFLVRYAGIPVSSFHLIGHSLGAHLSGHCGRYLQQTHGLVLPRITGLDPAGPFYIGAPPDERLDSSDAEFVDVIHTNNSPLLALPLSIGMTEPVGDLDFYPNGGSYQPKCNGNIACEHTLASKLFIASIRQSCTFIGIRCQSYEVFLQGDCWGCDEVFCSPMGIKAKPCHDGTTENKLFLLTNGDTPFCGSHYRVSIVSSNETQAQEHGGEFALIGIELIGPRDSTREILLSEKSVFYKSEQIYRRVILARDVGDLVMVRFTFHYPGSILNPMSWRIKGPSLHLHSVVVEQLEPERRWRFCFLDSRLNLNEKYELNKDNFC